MLLNSSRSFVLITQQGAFFVRRDKRRPNMTLYVAHDSSEKIHCSFFTVVIRNKALAQKYNGGLKGFMTKYSARCNNDIAVDCYMGDDVDDTVKDLLENGLTIDEDFTVFDVESLCMALIMDRDNLKIRHTVEIGVGWLKAQFIKGEGFSVWYSEN